jgi:hypothetical protein
MLQNPYTISQASQELQGLLHGTTLNQISDIYGVYRRAGSQLLLDLDPQETKVVANTPIIYQGVWDYTLPNDVKGTKVIDVYPQVNRLWWDIYVQRFGQQFDRNKSFSLEEMYTIEFNSGVKTLRVNAPFTASSVFVNGVNATLGWTGNTNVSNFVQNFTNFADSTAGAALQFNIASGANPQTATITNSTIGPINLTGYNGQSAFFLWVYMPIASHFSQVSINIGSSSANYYTLTTTQTQQGTAFQNGWNLVSFVWTPQTTQTGTPNITTINYLQLSLTYDGTAQNAVALCALYDRLGLVFNISYFSKYIFSDGTTNAFKEVPTSDSDYINLDTDTYNLFLFRLAMEAVQQQHGSEKNTDLEYFTDQYTKALNRYTKEYPSDAQKPQDTYYKMPQRSWRRWVGWRGW